MDKFTKILFFAIIVTSAVLFASVGFMVSKNPSKKVGEDIVADNLPRAKVQKEDTTKNVSTTNSETEVYILRYNPDSQKVELVTKKADGTEIVSNVNSINPFYLTEEDIKKLTEGIFVTTREDMFILIEDFSS